MLVNRDNKIVKEVEQGEDWGDWVQAPGGPLVFQGGYHPRKKIHVIRVVFQDQTMYARTSFRVSKTC